MKAAFEEAIGSNLDKFFELTKKRRKINGVETGHALSLLRFKGYSQRLFFAYYQPYIIINTLSEKSAPFVTPHSTVYPELDSGKQGRCPSISKQQTTFNQSESLCVGPEKRRACPELASGSILFSLTFLLLFFVKKKSK